MIYYLISAFVFTVLFVFYPAGKRDWLPQFMEVWVWNKDGGFGTRPYSNRENPFESLSGYKTENRFFSFKSKKFYSIPENYLIDYAPLEEGYFQYKKLGDEVSYYNGYKELFWTKSFSSYPRPGYFSTILPMVSGDGNTVFFADRNGNLVGLQSVDGRFAVDICYSGKEEETLVLFSGGEYYLVDESGNNLASHDIDFTSKYESTYFAKSCSISSNGEFFGIHYQSGDRDRIDVKSIKSDSIHRIELDKIYPHKIHFAISDLGSVLLAHSQGLELYSPKGKLLKSHPYRYMNQYFNSVFYSDGYFYWASRKDYTVWDEEGNEILKYPLTPSLGSVRFLPGKKDGTLYLESKKDIRQIVLF